VRSILFGILAAVLPPPPLPSLPVIARVKIEVAPAYVVVTEDVRFARGEWKSGDLDLFVAFGVPGAPRAFDAKVIPIAEEEFGAADGASGEPVAVDRASRRPPRARLLLGRESMAGVVVHLKEPAMRRAFSGGDALVLRLRSLVPTEGTSRDFVVRLGVEDGPPAALGSIDIVAGKEITNVEAKYCGPHADPYPVAAHLWPARTIPISYPRPASPLAVTRHADDDLCVRIFP
jgi:hypothetical protein